MASGDDEGRGKLRKCSGNRKQVLIRTCPNGATRRVEDSPPTKLELTRGTETSQYLEEEKESIDFLSSGDRKGKSLNRCCYGSAGVVGAFKGIAIRNRKALENAAAEGESPVRAMNRNQECHLSRAGHVKSCPNPRGPSRKAKYFRKTDSEPVP